MITYPIPPSKRTPFENALVALGSIDSRALFDVVFKRKDVQDFVIQLNTESQLFNQGVNSDGVKLSQVAQPYSEPYFKKKKKLGLAKSRDVVNLKLSGDTYDTWKVILGNGEIDIVADFAIHGFDLTKRYGNKLEGLTEDSISKLVEFIRPMVVKIIKQSVRGLR